MFQNINSGYTLEPVTHILCLRPKKKHAQVPTVLLCMSNMSFYCVRFSFSFLFVCLKQILWILARTASMSIHSPFFQNIDR